MSEETAYHESGHALVAIQLGAVIRHVTIEPEWDDGPERYADIAIEWKLDHLDTKEVEHRSIQIALAGPVAEMIYTGEPYHPGFIGEWASDWQIAWQSAERLFPDGRRRLRFLEQVTADLHQQLNNTHYWAAISAIADELMAHETLEGDQVEEIVRQWLG